LFNEKSENFCSEFHDFVEVVKRVVNHFKHTGMNRKLGHSLKPMINTRWNSLYVMLKSIHLEFENIIKFLNERNELHRYSIDKNLLEGIILILEPFRKAINDLSSSSVPTLNIVIPKIQTLKNSLKPLNDENNIINNFKQYLLSGIEDKVQSRINEWHNLAFLLDPRFKNSNLLNENDKRNAKNSLTKLVTESHESLQMNESESETEEPIPKAKKDEFSEFYGSSSQTITSDHNKEIEYYFDEKFKIPILKNGYYNPIAMYWKSKVDVWPNLSAIALWILSVPASSTRSEETFSLSGWMINKRRTSLSPKHVNMVLVVKSKLFN
jgi:hypothetical protein